MYTAHPVSIRKHKSPCDLENKFVPLLLIDLVLYSIFNDLNPWCKDKPIFFLLQNGYYIYIFHFLKKKIKEKKMKSIIRNDEVYYTMKKLIFRSFFLSK